MEELAEHLYIYMQIEILNRCKKDLHDLTDLIKFIKNIAEITINNNNKLQYGLTNKTIFRFIDIIDIIKIFNNNK